MGAHTRARGPLALITAACLTVGGAVTACQSSSTSATTTTRLGPTTPQAIPQQAARQLTAPATPRVTVPVALPTPDRPPAPLPPWPSRRDVRRWSCDRIVEAVNGTASRCVDPGDRRLRTEAVDGAERTVGLTDEEQHVYVQRGMSADDTYLVAMHERGHQELRQRCDTWLCGDVILHDLRLSRRSWGDGSYFDRAVETAASTWARCHGADNPRYGYRLSCQDLQRAFETESAARRRYSEQQDALTEAWRTYRQDYERYRSALAHPTQDPGRTP